jgi:hypothetical protein
MLGLLWLYNPTIGVFMPENLKNFKHSGISQCVGFNTLQIQELSNTLIIGSQQLGINLRINW